RRLGQIRDAQQAILVRPEEIPGANFAVHYLSILEAGGDFYDVFPVGNDVYVFFVSDISGHDLGASFATSALKALIRQNTVDVYTAEETMQMINQVLTQIFSDGQHLTSIFARLDRSRGLLTLINAAHLPLLYLSSKGEMQLLEADGDIVGAFAGGIYNRQQISVQKGDRFFMYTDGLLELFSDKTTRNRAEGLLELERLCLETRGLPVAQAVQGIVAAMFSGSRQPEDDVILLGVDI
ncbi:MAG: PP2C family protein-serine/threonine phosphatase, partial [Pseudomonadota bacterium]|nr:PP2C family protein-serine/threonine phosphatase [Pseudomonadota bacterium]